MSYSIVSKGKGNKEVTTFSTICNHVGCKAVVTSTEGKGASWQSARSQGWFSDSAANHRCPAHRPSALRAIARKVAKVAKVVTEPVKGKASKKVAKSAGKNKKSVN
jgi:hypothetical protein